MVVVPIIISLLKTNCFSLICVSNFLRYLTAFYNLNSYSINYCLNLTAMVVVPIIIFVSEDCEVLNSI